MSGKRKLAFETDEDYCRPHRKETRQVVIEGDCSISCSFRADVSDEFEESPRLLDNDLDVKSNGFLLNENDHFGSLDDDLLDTCDEEPLRDRPRARARFRGKKKRAKTLVEIPVEKYLDTSCEEDANFDEQNKVIVKRIPWYYNNVKTLCRYFEKFGEIKSICCYHASKAAHIVFHDVAHATAASTYPMVLMDRSNQSAWGHNKVSAQSYTTSRKPRRKGPSFKTRGFKPRKKWSKLVKPSFMNKRVREQVLTVHERKTRFVKMCEKLKNRLQFLIEKETDQRVRDFFEESIAKCERHIFHFKASLDSNYQKLSIGILAVEQQKEKLVRDLMDIEMEIYRTKTLDMNLIHRIDQLTHELLHARI